MLKHSFVIATFLILFVFSCKKETKEIDPITKLFDNTIWTGEMRYVNRPIPEPYSIAFYANGNLEWNEMNCNCGGYYTLDKEKREVTINFSRSSFVASITDDGKFENFRYKDDPSPFVIQTGELNHSTEQPLDHTNWKNSFQQVNFMPGSKIILSNSPGERTYTRKDGSLRFSDAWGNYFGVISGDHIKGIYFFPHQVIFYGQ